MSTKPLTPKYFTITSESMKYWDETRKIAEGDIAILMDDARGYIIGQSLELRVSLYVGPSGLVKAVMLALLFKMQDAQIKVNELKDQISNGKKAPDMDFISAVLKPSTGPEHYELLPDPDPILEDREADQNSGHLFDLIELAKVTGELTAYKAFVDRLLENRGL